MFGLVEEFAYVFAVETVSGWCIEFCFNSTAAICTLIDAVERREREERHGECVEIHVHVCFIDYVAAVLEHLDDISACSEEILLFFLCERA